ncbi:MAG: PAS domain-containing sensor histidine kinase [Bacteroidia bacterium]|nr:PAS domain-containing sensor histidine kinase [Bacteroidia bacterium]
MLNLGKNTLLDMEQLNALFEHATEGIIIANRQGVIIKANPSSERLFGYNLGELEGKKVEEIVPDKYKGNHEKHRESFHANPHARSMGKGIDLFAKRKDGTEFPAEISLSYYTKGNDQFVIAFIIDISERKKVEERIKKLNAELETKVDERTRVLKETMMELEASKEELKEALEKEKELNDMKSRFVTMASHEFRTPLSTILSSVSLIGKYKQEEEDEKRQKHVERIKSAVTNMTLILNDFLSAGKLEEGKISNNPIELNVVKLVNEIASELSNLLKPSQKIQYNHLGNEELLIDKQFLRNILINLLSNAIKFSPENKNIILNTKIDENCFEIMVQDQGIGIPEEEQKHLFERFFRAKNASNIQGTGLGLNIVSKYVEELKGKLTFESKLNEGTIFKIKIPLHN